MIGTQLFGLRNELTKNRGKTLRLLKQMGYQAIEPTVSLANRAPVWNPSAWTLADLRERFTEAQEMDLAVPSVHMDLGLFGKPAQKIIPVLLQIHKETGISVFVFSGMFATEKNAQKWGKLLHTVSDGVKNAGCVVLYHNHDMEFSAVSGNMLLDLFFKYAGPDVGLQLDIGWAGMAWNEVEAAKKYAERIVELHCKDFAGGRGQYTSANMPRELFAPVGAGIIQTGRVLEMTASFPQFRDVVIVDQDASAGDMMKDLRTGLHQLQEMGL